MNTCMVYMAIKFPLDGIQWCLCFIFRGEGSANLLEREKAKAQSYGGNNFLVLWNETVIVTVLPQQS